jgi:hypothetical protein
MQNCKLLGRMNALQLLAAPLAGDTLAAEHLLLAALNSGVSNACNAIAKPASC